MKMLLLDDKMERVFKIRALAAKHGLQIADTNVLNDAIKKLKEDSFDIFVVDLYVPEYHGKEVQSESGIKLLNDIFNTKNLIRPANIIVISDHLNEIPYLEQLMDLPISVISTSNTENWYERMDLLFDKLCCSQVDIAIITATETEFNAIYDTSWRLQIRIGKLKFYKKIFKEKKISAILVQTESMGMIYASYLMSTLFKYYHPKQVVMIGVLAGDPEDTNLGDIIVASSAYYYSSGAIKEDENGNLVFESDPVSVDAKDDFVGIFAEYGNNIMSEIKTKVDTIFSKPGDRKVKNACKNASIKVGYVVTGPSVVKSATYRELFIEKFFRKYLGLDMETYPVYFFCQKQGDVDFISIKSVCDNANKDKNSTYQPYCAKLASELLLYYIENSYTV